jgi:hypothetical protein
MAMITIKHRWNSDLVVATFDLETLVRANLSGADLSGADLRSADLRSADLSGADLRSADLRSANLRSADLSSANLRSADLSSANLRGANLSGANLRGANLSGANLDKIILPAFQIVPEEGTFVAWKKVLSDDDDNDFVVLRLQIPEDAKRVSTPTERKCRADKVLVLAAYGQNGAEITNEAVFYSNKDSNFTYRVGEIAEADQFNDDIREVCTYGLHFFLTRKEAEEYEF